MTPEGKLKNDCGTIARVNRMPFWQIEGKGINGIPDTIAGHMDRRGVVLIEFKVETDLSKQQEIRLSELRRMGQRVAVCRSVDDYRRAVGLLNDEL